MKRFKCLFFVNSLLLFLFPFSASAETFKVGVVPQFDVKTIHSIWKPILEVLNEKTGHEFILKGSKDIPAFERKLSEGEFDFAYMNPYHYTISQHYRPIVKDHGRKLYGVLVVNSGGEIQNVNQLNGATLVFPAPNALGASLMIRSELEQKYGISFSSKFVNTHSSVYLNVALNQSPAGGGVQKTFNQQNNEVKDKLRILLKTDSVEPHPFTARKDLPPEIVKIVSDALIEMGKSNNHNSLLGRVPFKQIGVATDSDYDGVRALNLERYYVSPEK